VLLVEQNAIATLQIADRAYLMETGEITLEGTAADLAHNPEVKRAYLGKGGQQPWHQTAPPTSLSGGSSGKEGGGTNPKPEGREPKEIRRPKSEEAKPRPSNETRPGAETDRQQLSRSARSHGGEGVGDFGLRISDFLRISGFGLRIWRRDLTSNLEEHTAPRHPSQP
jgi:hypothetical protein